MTYANAIYLDRAQVPAILRKGYNGTRFNARPCESMTIPSDAGLWSGGSRTTYTAIELATGREQPLPSQSSAPWDKNRVERTVELRPGFAIVAHAIFCGTDCGLTFYVHPQDVAQLLPPSNGAELTDQERLYLAVIRSRKSAYRADEYRRKGFTQAQLDALRAAMLDRGMIDARGAITTAGKNACAGVNVL